MLFVYPEFYTSAALGTLYKHLDGAIYLKIDDDDGTEGIPVEINPNWTQLRTAVTPGGITYDLILQDMQGLCEELLARIRQLEYQHSMLQNRVVELESKITRAIICEKIDETSGERKIGL